MSRLLDALCVGRLCPSTISAGLADVPRDLAKWIAVDPPEPGSDGWVVANSDVKHEWSVTLCDDRPRAVLRTSEAPASLPFDVEPGSSREGLSGRRFSV